MRKLIPQLLAAATLGTGILNILSTLFVFHSARLQDWQEVVPLNIVHASRTLVLLVGSFMIFLAREIWRRKRTGFYLVTVALTLSVVLHLTKVDYEETVVLTVVLLIFLWQRHQFTVRNGDHERTTRWIISVVTVLYAVLYPLIGFFVLNGSFTHRVSISAIINDYRYQLTGGGEELLIPITTQADWFEDSIAITNAIALLVLLSVIFIPQRLTQRVTEQQWLRAKQIIRKYGTHSLSYYGLMNDKQYFFADGALICYSLQRNTAVVLGDPIGPQDKVPIVLLRFVTSMAECGKSVVFVSSANRALYQSLGMKALPIGEEAVVDVAHFTVHSPALKEVRNSITRMQRLGVTFVWHSAIGLPRSVDRQIRSLLQRWREQHSYQSYRFSMNFYPFLANNDTEILTVYDAQQNLIATLSFLPYRNFQSRILDLLVRDSHGPNGVLEAALAHAITHFAEQGVEEVNLGMAAYHRSCTVQSDSVLAERGLTLVQAQMRRLYQYESLAHFKKKFAPRWEPRYMIYTSDFELPKVTLAIAQAHTQRGLIKSLLAP